MNKVIYVFLVGLVFTMLWTVVGGLDFHQGIFALYFGYTAGRMANAVP